MTRSYDLALDNPVTGAGVVQITALVHGGVDQGANPDQSVALRLNGHEVGVYRWDGMVDHLITASVPTGWLDGAPNRMHLTAALSQLPALPPPPGGGSPYYWVSPDWVRISYPALANAADDRLYIEGVARTGQPGGGYRLHAPRRRLGAGRERSLPSPAPGRRWCRSSTAAPTPSIGTRPSPAPPTSWRLRRPCWCRAAHRARRAVPLGRPRQRLRLRGHRGRGARLQRHDNPGRTIGRGRAASAGATARQWRAGISAWPGRWCRTSTTSGATAVSTRWRSAASLAMPTTTGRRRRPALRAAGGRRPLRLQQGDHSDACPSCCPLIW